jgi:hypothetical protein
MSYSMPAVPQPNAVQRLQWGVSRRNETDYIFDFWTAFGWTLLTCGLYGFYVFYRLFWRSVEHNKRRIEVLDAATLLAWQRATDLGRADELTPRFQILGGHMNELRGLASEFRDPAIWTLISAVSSGIGQIVGYVFLDMDLVRHEAAEQAAEQELGAICAALGVPVALPAPVAPKQRHNYVGRIVALLASCGLYGLWWLYDLMTEGNEHQRRSWASDDALWVAAGSFGAPAT